MQVEQSYGNSVQRITKG